MRALKRERENIPLLNCRKETNLLRGEKERETERERERDRQTDRQSETDRQTDRERVERE